MFKALLHKLVINSDFLIPKSVQSDVVDLDISNYEFCLIYLFEISKVYTIGSQRYGD